MSVFSIPPHEPFLPRLAGAIMDGTLLNGWDRTSPFWLSDVTVILPTQRARQGLADAFARHWGFTGLLPDIRTFGGDEADEEPFLPPFDAEKPRPPATGLQRRLVLSRLVAGWAHSPRGRQAFSTPPTAAEIFSMADSLGRLIDDLVIEERTPADIRALGERLGPDLGEYWQQTLEFLDIALTLWPNLLGQWGTSDPAALRAERLDRQALAAPFVFGERPVIAAGSTGSIPATARLLAAVAALERGAVVLPGLDRAMRGESFEALFDPKANPHGHPQYGLAHLLRALDTRLEDVVELSCTDHARTVLVNHALALTADTALWSGQRPEEAVLDEALDGVSIIDARTEDEEARAIALASRAALEDKKSVGIVTPDRNLARRIAAELRRFSIEVDDAAGTPLFHTPAGRLARQVLNLVVARCAPVDLMALLRNRACVLGRGRTQLARLAETIDLLVLRGQRPSAGIEGVRALLAQRSTAEGKRSARIEAERAEAISGLLDDLETAIAPLTALLQSADIDAATLASALWTAIEGISAGEALHGRDELAGWAAQVAALAGEGHRFAPQGLDAVLATLMTGFDVRNREERRSDIAIWGQLEARLMSPDVLILAALNEDKWPAAADPGPWLSRDMRIKAGLEPPERQQGLAAHDFAQGLGNATVILAYAERIGSSPALPSRLVQRVDAFVGETQAVAMRARGAMWKSAAREIDAVPAVVAAPRPAPNPPLAARPRSLSVTEIETLMRSPYDIYAKHILRLRPLDPLGEEPDARERGTIIHAIFARFVIEKVDPFATDAFERLMGFARDAFAGLDAIGERRDIWLRRFATAAEQFLQFEQARAPYVHERRAEISGRMELPLPGGFTIRGQADRVDSLTDGTLELLDFKTGSVPSKTSMNAFEAPQLPLEALMAEAGGMAGIGPAKSSALTYVKVGLGPEAFKPSPYSTPEGMSIMEAAEEIGRRTQRHIDLFLMQQTALPSRLFPRKGQSYAGPYDHLARVAEWTQVEEEDEP